MGAARAGVNQNLEQVWFAGVHCNVGGGYEDSGLSDLAFLWMQEKAAACGLAFDVEYLESRIHPNLLGVLRDSKAGFFDITGTYLRPIGRGKNAQESVHLSVKERRDRITNPVYQPENLLEYLRDIGPR